MNVLSDEAIALHKEYASTHFNKGIAHSSLGETLEAIEAFTNGLAFNPNDDRIRHLLGGALLSRAKALQPASKEAEEYLSRAMIHINDSIANDAKNPSALHLRCEIGNLLGYEAKENLHFCMSALNANRENLVSLSILDEDVTLNLLGVITKNMLLHTEAIEYFSQGLEVNPESYDLLVNLASIHSDTGNHVRANIYFEQAEALNIDNPLLRAYLLANKGWDKEKQGLRLAARDLYQQAIQLSEPHPHPQFVTNLHNIDRYCEVSQCN